MAANCRFIIPRWCKCERLYSMFPLLCAPKIFNATTDALEWIIADQGRSFLEFILHYLDDFLLGGSPGSDSCGRVLDLALRICMELGFPVMAEKVVGPSTTIEFLGFLIDSVAMEIRLPEEKLSRLKQMIQAWKRRKSCTKHELLSLIANLQHASSVVKPGCTFLRQMIDLSKRRVHLDGHLRLNTKTDQPPLCPVTAILSYLVERKLADGPLFICENGHFLTRAHFVQEVKRALEAAGVSLIKMLGRWESDAYQRYIRIPRQELASYTKRMVS